MSTEGAPGPGIWPGGAKMNERKPGRVGNPQGGAARADSMQTNPLRSEATMHTDAQVRKGGGRLSREDQRRIGDILQRVYDEVLRQGVLDRFKDLLDQFDRTEEDSEAAAAAQWQEAGGRVGAKAFDNKGWRS